MVKAILSGKKTQTRRLIKIKKEITDPKLGYTTFTPDGHISVRGKHKNGEYGESFIKCPYGEKGDVLWVRETWMHHGRPDISLKEYIYKADKPLSLQKAIKWKPSIFMPKMACRIRLKVKSISIEKLTDISEKDAKAEGAEKGRFIGYGRVGMKSYKEGFLGIWLDINGEINKNDYVWVVKFERYG